MLSKTRRAHNPQWSIHPCSCSTQLSFVKTGTAYLDLKSQHRCASSQYLYSCTLWWLKRDNIIHHVWRQRWTLQSPQAIDTTVCLHRKHAMYCCFKIHMFMPLMMNIVQAGGIFTLKRVESINVYKCCMMKCCCCMPHVHPCFWCMLPKRVWGHILYRPYSLSPEAPIKFQATQTALTWMIHKTKMWILVAYSEPTTPSILGTPLSWYISTNASGNVDAYLYLNSHTHVL